MIPRVLVVDDDDAVRRVIAALLARSGFDVSTAADAGPALRIAEVATPDLVVVDYNMPSGGLTVVRALKKRHGSAIYVAVLTGDDDPEMHEECCVAGADAVLLKPISPNELRRVLIEAAHALDASPAA
jgi:CheY-like chemotaxis protein